ncbi:MAG TPA: mechanosensitive ion channel family protein, partial [Usitatibacter sp.]|nr:mechanosensitive ion channel family protein [Usitatibacter sp.]
AIGVALVMGLALLVLRPADRASARNALVVLAVCTLATLAEALLASFVGVAPAAIAADISSVLAGVVIVRLATLFLFRPLLPAIGLAPARIAEDIVTAVLYVGWGLAWMRLSGMKPESLFATSAVVTAVVAFAMQDTLGNVLGGVLLQLDRSIRVGDWVQIAEVGGRVVEIRWRHTAVETRAGETVIFPNGWLIKNRFTVVGSRSAPEPVWRRTIHMNVDLSAAPNEVCRVLEESVRNAAIPNVAASPAATAVMMDVGARSGSYNLRYWLTDPAADDPTDSMVRAHAIAALQRAGMKLGAPFQEQLDIRDDAEHRALEMQDEMRQRTEALARVELFALLSDAERASLAKHLVYAPFVAGDVMTRQGAVAHWLYLIVGGEAEVWLDTPAGRERIATISAGGVFGEMGMMTGAPRTATVTARSDVICYRLDKAGFAEIIKARPDVTEGISKVLARRHDELVGRMAAGMNAAPATRHDDILARIRSFFGLEPEPRKSPVRKV